MKITGLYTVGYVSVTLLLSSMTVEGCDQKELDRCIGKCVRQEKCDKDDSKCEKKAERKCGKSCSRKCGKTDKPTKSPKTDKPTKSPKTDSPTASPTASPTVSPTVSPTAILTKSPSESPTASPTASPTVSPTVSPTAILTKSPSESPTESPVAYVPNKGLVACGRKTGTCSPYSKKVSPAALFNVRCCSDTVRTGNLWKKNTQAGCTVWARSDVGGLCSKVTYNGAKKRCADSNARICTAKEIEDNCSLGSGCQLFNKYVWTADLV